MDDATRLEILREAWASGVLNVRHGDVQTTFRSLAEMEAIIRGLSAGVIAGGGSVRGAAGRRLRYPRQRTKGL